MSSSSIFDNPQGRNALFTGIVALLLVFLAFYIPLVENPAAWNKFLYKDLTLPEKDRYNIWLVLLETIILTLIYFFTLICLGSYAEFRNRLPSWGEVFTSGIFTIALATFFPRFSVGGGLQGTTASTGYNYFTSSMQWSVFFGTVLGMVLVTLYIMYSEEEKQ